MTPQHEKQIGYWASDKFKLKPNSHITKYVQIHNVIKIQCRELYTINLSQLGLFKIYSTIEFVFKISKLVWGGI